MPPRDLVERTRLFALSVVMFCRQLPPSREAQEAASQLRRAANSVRANYRAARRGRSRAEFLAKLGTVFEEADECVDTLAYLRDTRVSHDRHCSAKRKNSHQSSPRRYERLARTHLARADATNSDDGEHFSTFRLFHFSTFHLQPSHFCRTISAGAQSCRPTETHGRQRHPF